MRIELDRVTLRYAERTVLREVSACIEPGDFVVIRGPSGSGKSSLCRLLNRLQEPSSGRVIHGGGIGSVTELRRRVAYLQQTPVMVGGTVRDNLLFPFRFRVARGGPPPPGDETLRRELDGLGLADLDLEAEAATLSVGQKQRVALLRVIGVEPEVLLADEPTSALDPDSRRAVESRIDRWAAGAGRTVVMVTHLPPGAGDGRWRRWRLADGRIEEESSP